MNSHLYSQTPFKQQYGPQPNIGRVDRYIRLASGVLLLASGLQRGRRSLGKTVLVSLGASKIAEGVTGWCPLTYLMSILSTSINSENSENDEMIRKPVEKLTTAFANHDKPQPGREGGRENGTNKVQDTASQNNVRHKPEEPHRDGIGEAHLAQGRDAAKSEHTDVEDDINAAYH